MFKGFITMNDGATNRTLFMKSKADVLRVAREQMKLQNHYYRKDGVDYGKAGKWFTYEEEHGGLKELVIVEYTETNRETITSL